MNDSRVLSPIVTLPSSQMTEEFMPATTAPAETNRVITVDENTAFTLRLQQITPIVYVTAMLMITNLVVWLTMVLAGAGVMGDNVDLYLKWGANFAPLTSDGQGWRLLTSAFLHFGIVHLAFNLLALWNVGNLTERMYGNGVYLAIYLVAAITGGFASLFIHSQPIVSAGASGAIFGLYGALFGFLIRQRGGIPASVLEPMMKNTVVYIAYSLYTGFTSVGVDNAAHIGGLIGGFVTGLAFAAPLEWESRQINRWRSIFLGSAVSLLWVGGSWLALPPVSVEAKADLAFNELLDQFSKDEALILPQYQTLITQMTDGKINYLDFSTEIERCCLQFYQTTAIRLQQIQLPQTSQHDPLYQLLTKYTNQRIQYFQLIIQGLREQNEELFQTVQQVGLQTQETLDELKEIQQAATR